MAEFSQVFQQLEDERGRHKTNMKKERNRHTANIRDIMEDAGIIGLKTKLEENQEIKQEREQILGNIRDKIELYIMQNKKTSTPTSIEARITLREDRVYRYNSSTPAKLQVILDYADSIKQHLKQDAVQKFEEVIDKVNERYEEVSKVLIESKEVNTPILNIAEEQAIFLATNKPLQTGLVKQDRVIERGESQYWKQGNTFKISTGLSRKYIALQAHYIQDYIELAEKLHKKLKQQLQETEKLEEEISQEIKETLVAEEL